MKASESEKIIMKIFAPCEKYEDEYIGKYTPEEEEPAKQALIEFFKKYKKITPTLYHDPLTHKRLMYTEGYFDPILFFLLFRSIRGNLRAGQYHWACSSIRDLIHEYNVHEIRIFVALVTLYERYLKEEG